jgi:hypothetical protein
LQIFSIDLCQENPLEAEEEEKERVIDERRKN